MVGLLHSPICFTSNDLLEPSTLLTIRCFSDHYKEWIWIKELSEISHITVAARNNYNKLLGRTSLILKGWKETRWVCWPLLERERSLQNWPTCRGWCNTASACRFDLRLVGNLNYLMFDCARCGMVWSDLKPESLGNYVKFEMCTF